jgi:cytochrome c-type biogenesis protein CcmH/NrfF
MTTEPWRTAVENCSIHPWVLPCCTNILNQEQHSKMQPTQMEAILRGSGRESEELRQEIVRDVGMFTSTLFGVFDQQGNAGGSHSQDRGLVAHGAVPLRHTFLTVVVLASIALALDGDSVRVQSLTTKVFCNCGCREVLAECSHLECKPRVSLKREIASAIVQGKGDDRILDDLGRKYGATILVVPAFRGFDALLWIVPIAVALIALIVFVWRRWSVAAAQNR